jgi:3-methyladenine DNA glycosylase/8-oxoguanine DNA glycosylase
MPEPLPEPLAKSPPEPLAKSPPEPLGLAWRAPFPVDLRTVLSVHRRGPRDPAFRIDGIGAVWRTSLTPDGPATLRVAAPRPAAADTPPAPAAAPAPAADTADTAGVLITATAWGPGAAWLLEMMPSLLGAQDNPESFAPAHPLLREMARRHRGARVGRSGRVLEALVPAVLEQKVVGLEAHRAWRLLLLRFGDPAPGPAPAGMRVFPAPVTWAAIPSWEWHAAGVEAVRARTIAAAARVSGRLEEILAMASADADCRLRALPGIGPWTSAEVRQRACGDADAVTVGDYHLPAAVGWALAGRPVDDAGMLRLLAPYAGHRHRAARLVELSGARPPRRGPRLPPRDYRAF